MSTRAAVTDAEANLERFSIENRSREGYRRATSTIYEPDEFRLVGNGCVLLLSLRRVKYHLVVPPELLEKERRGSLLSHFVKNL